MTRKIAIVGSREYPRMDLVRKIVRSLPNDVIIVSGGAIGVDSIAAHEAATDMREVQIFKPDWNRLGKGAGLVRNQQIVDASDEVIAFWDQESKGTASTIKMTIKSGKPLTIYGINGEKKKIP